VAADEGGRVRPFRFKVFSNMNRNTYRLVRLGAVFAIAFASGSAFAHAHLSSAAPGAGATVNVSPDVLTLTFTEGVEPKFSGVTLTDASGAAQTLGALSVDPAKPSVVTVQIGTPLKAGVYTVNWHVVALDTHKTQGSFTFKFAP
jgi:copper resistance protein C